jgi:hypothetical protein
MSELLARRFHEAYERLAPTFGYETRASTREFDPYSANGKLMIAACTEIESQQAEQIERLEAAMNSIKEDYEFCQIEHHEPDRAAAYYETACTTLAALLPPRQENSDGN